MSDATYAIGVDLGTTHCAVAAVDRDLCEGEDVALSGFSIPQVVASGEVASRPLLPSMLYLPTANELPSGAASLPWNPTPAAVLGEFARKLGERTPDHLVVSAKSWLSHAGVDRRERMLPENAPKDLRRVSPVEAAVALLSHLRQAWDHKNPRDAFVDQDITLTVPASFDPAARELTAEAATEAGYKNLTLLEEPLAALYSWIQARGSAWRDELSVGDVVLVVDVGGGTTDFSLIAVTEDDGRLTLERVAVGNHILLGGDNMDLALATLIARKLEAEDKHLEDWQFDGLRHACRNAKETLLRGEQESIKVLVPSRGSKLVGSSLRGELTKAEVEAIVVGGFFPMVEASAQPASRPRSALSEMGLPYAQDPAVTRHLAAFLSRQRQAIQEARSLTSETTSSHPTAVLFNGGVLKAGPVAARVMDVLASWSEADGQPAPRLLEGADLDRGVARGAAYYGYARDGEGVKIHGGLAQAFYVGVESSMPAIPGLEPELHALCVAPFGLDEGSNVEPLPQELGLIVGESVRFRFFASSVRRDDELGTLLRRWSPDELTELGAIEASLPAEGGDGAQVVPVNLRARVTELGVLVLEAIPRGGGQPYAIELDVRSD